MIKALRTVFAPFVIAGFFHRDQDQLVTHRGAAVLADPTLKAQVEEALASYCEQGQHGPVVVRFRPMPQRPEHIP